MRDLLIVGSGGFLGAAARYGLSRFFDVAAEATLYSEVRDDKRRP